MVHLSADKWSEAECIRADKWFPEFPQDQKCVCYANERMCGFVFAYQYLSKESSNSQSLWSSFQTFNHFKVVLRFGNTDLNDVMLYTCVCKRGIKWFVLTC